MCGVRRILDALNGAHVAFGHDDERNVSIGAQRSGCKLACERRGIRHDHAFGASALLERETKALDLRFRQQFEARQNRFRLLLQELNGLSPTAKLVNGYGYISKDGKPLVSVQDVEKGDTLHLKIHDGEIRATAEEILPEGTKS